jgi:membrane protein implicated in regulation of membrane protease activity
MTVGFPVSNNIMLLVTGEPTVIDRRCGNDTLVACERFSWTIGAMIDWSIPWWGWITFGVALALLELASPGGFYFIFFGVGAAVVGIIAWIGLVEQAWLQFALFSILSLLSSIFFRRPLMNHFGPKYPEKDVDTLIGETATAIDSIQAKGFGKVELRGAAWTARNNSAAGLKRGERCTVERVDGLSLWVRKEDG